MTLVLGALTNDYAILGADRRILVGPSLEGPFTPGEAGKLFEVGGCSVASFGRSPQGVGVPDLVRGFIGHLREPRALGYALVESIRGLPDRGNFGLLVAGSGAQQPELWEVTKGAQACLKLRTGVLHEREDGVGSDGEALMPDAEQQMARLLEILRLGSLRHSSSVGPPFDISLLRFGREPIGRQHPF